MGIRLSVEVPLDVEYEETCRVYNAMIDKRPAFIARCSDAADVLSAVNFDRSDLSA